MNSRKKTENSRVNVQEKNEVLLPCWIGDEFFRMAGMEGTGSRE